MSAEFGKLLSGVEKQAKTIYDAGKSETKKKLDETSGYQELKDEIVTLKYEINELKHEMEKLKGVAEVLNLQQHDEAIILRREIPLGLMWRSRYGLASSPKRYR